MIQWLTSSTLRAAAQSEAQTDVWTSAQQHCFFLLHSFVLNLANNVSCRDDTASINLDISILVQLALRARFVQGAAILNTKSDIPW